MEISCSMPTALTFALRAARAATRGARAFLEALVERRTYAARGSGKGGGGSSEEGPRKERPRGVRVGSDAAERILDTVSDIGFRSSTRGDARAPRLDPYLRGSRDRHGHSGGHCYGQRGRRSARRRRLRACVSAERALPFPENATVRRSYFEEIDEKNTAT